MSDRQISILVHTVNFCGDHAQDAFIALEQIPGETVEDLLERAKLGKNQYAGQGEFIAIRVLHKEVAA
jgi:hypothetical protein